MKFDFLTRILFKIRNFLCRSIFIEFYNRELGEVLDIGGASFFEYLDLRRLSLKSWVTLDISESLKPKIDDPRFSFVIGDGKSMSFQDNTFNTISCIQVLEHIFEPIKVFEESVRVLKPGGTGIIVVPQTGVIHLIPHHYQNFTRYWLEEACLRTGVEIEKLVPLGGGWQTIASRLFFFFLVLIKRPENSGKEHIRSIKFYVLLPLMVLTCLVFLPITLLLSLGDYSEEPPNHLLVFRKPI